MEIIIFMFMVILLFFTVLPVILIIALVKGISYLSNPEYRIQMKQRRYKEELEAQERARKEFEKEHNT